MSSYESYRHRLLHQPERQWDQDPTEVLLTDYKDQEPTFSVVMPIHNQENIIQRVLRSVTDMTLGYYELILILDGCTDGTRERILEWVGLLNVPNYLVRIHILENPQGIFETSCDNQGFVLARGKYIVEVQADMVVLTFGYNILLTSPLENYRDLIAVSGRCCHGMNKTPGAIRVGKLGEDANRPHAILQEFEAYGKVFLSHTINRGPLVLRRSMLEELGFLDEAHYVLGEDEHDLFARAWVQKQWRCGFVPVEVYSPLEWGSTRKARAPEAQAYLDQREKNKSNGFLGQNRSTIEYPTHEFRPYRIAGSLV
jgi:glycosyltransferase involved in cell wall biosynthesis